MNSEAHLIKDLKALIVDDEPDNLTVSQSILEFFGASVRVARSGPEALAIASEWQPKIILLDIAMPNMTGWDTLRDLRKMPAMESTPVIAFTAQVDADDADELFAKGFNGHIVKPFEIEDMLNAIISSLQKMSPDVPATP